MARTTPQVVNGRLTGHSGQESVAVGSSSWFAWLEQATRFAFRDPAGTFTARREVRGRGTYWRAYRTIDNRQRRAYLGRSADLTPERLRAVAAQLATDPHAPAASAAGRETPADPSPASSAPEAPESFVLLATKVYVPRPRSVLVPRSRLLQRLEAGLRGPLTVIAAPAGFGKTTLLADWLAPNDERGTMNDERPNHRSSLIAHRSKVAWLSLDAGDNDPTIFLRYLIAALRMVMPPTVGAMALALLEASPLPSLATLLTTLINDLTGLDVGDGGREKASAHLNPQPSTPNPWILVLDDYHVITTPAIHTALTFLLDHLPPTVHLVVASREDPPLPLARQRARGQVAELRATDLRFTLGEATAFLRDVM
jgi:LuxR family transcriptional regulator, maltose regulon positive regulatory protein